jgi:hypothetical protein
LKPDLMLGLTGGAGIYLRRKQYDKAPADNDNTPEMERSRC